MLAKLQRVVEIGGKYAGSEAEVGIGAFHRFFKRVELQDALYWAEDLKVFDRVRKADQDVSRNLCDLASNPIDTFYKKLLVSV